MIIKNKNDTFKYFIYYHYRMVKLKNKEEIKYLKKILDKVREINAKSDHIITVFRERFYTVKSQLFFPSNDN